MTMRSLLRGRALAVALGAALALAAGAAQAYAGPDALRARYDELQPQLQHNAFHREMYVDSSESGDTLKGDVYAVLDYPFPLVSKTLARPQDWCDVMMLPFNAKFCRAVPGNGGGATLQVGLGRKYDQPAADAYKLDFALQPVAASAQYFESRLHADSGPIGTRDYRIVVSAVPIDARRTFMHFSYSYAYGMAGRIAMQAYLSTAGADKVGFSTDRDGNGPPHYVGGVRGAIERTAMRYYLAIDAQMASLSVPHEQRLDKRIETWFRETERYPRQLHEMDHDTYVSMKRNEYGRQQQAKAE
jgi:hypothetical protein